MCKRYPCILFAVLSLSAALTGSAAAVDEKVTLSGVVVDTEDNPVADAEIFYDLWAYKPRSWLSNDLDVPSPYRGFQLVDPDTTVVPPVRSDAQGRFRLEVPKPYVKNDVAEIPVVWAYSPRHRIQYTRLEKSVDLSAPIRLELPPSGNSRIKTSPDFCIRLVDAQNKPIQGATVTVIGINQVRGRGTRFHDPSVPDPPKALQSRLTTTTDGQGWATLATVGDIQVQWVEVFHPLLGRRSCHTDLFHHKSQTLRMTPGAKVRGRIVADRPEVTRRARVCVMTATVEERNDKGTFVKSAAEVTTNDAGEFDTPLLAEGNVFFWLPDIEAPADGKPAFLLPPMKPKELRCDAQCDVELRLEPTVRIHGMARDKSSGKPITVSFLLLKEGADSVWGGRCDTTGPFELRHLPGQWKVLCWSADGDTYICASPWEGVVPAGVEEFTVPTFDLSRLRGRVADEQGEPVGQALVEVSWRYPGETPKGRQSEGATRAVTDKDGAYSFWVDPALEFRLKVSAEKMADQETAWTSLDKLANAAMPDVALVAQAGLRPTLAGRVVDRQGEPVAGAMVSASGECKPQTTDTNGRFQFKRLAHERLAVCVAASGFCFHGQWVDKETDRIEIVLSRLDGPPPPLRTMLPTVTTIPQRIELLGLMLDAFRQHTSKAEKEWDAERKEIFEFLNFEENALVSESWTEYRQNTRLLRRAILKEEDDPSQFSFLRWLRGMGEDWCYYMDCRRCLAFQSWMPRDNPTWDKICYLLSQGNQSAIDGHKNELELLAFAAEQRLKQGNAKAASELFRQGRELMASSPNQYSDSHRVEFAIRLAQTDFPAAKAIVDRLCPRHQELFLERMAEFYARTNPPEAERFLQLRRKGTWHSEIEAVEMVVCYNMAPVDLPRARRLASQVERPDVKAKVLAMLAKALADSRPAEAAVLLREAFDTLDDFNARRGDRWLVVVAAAMVNVAYQVDPPSVDEFFWRTVRVASVIPAGTAPLESSWDMATEFSLALLLSRFDDAVGKKVFADAWNRIPKELRGKAFFCAAAIAPEKAHIACQHLSEDDEIGDVDPVNLETLLIFEHYWDKIIRQFVLDHISCQTEDFFEPDVKIGLSHADRQCDWE